MARRSSARLRERNSSTPQPVKRVSLSHDALPQAPQTVPSKLSTLAESDEMPGSFPDSPDVTPTQPSKRARPFQEQETTPRRATPIKPSDAEMHPQRHHQTAAKPREEARWLGFSKMAPMTEPSKKSGVAQDTPTKAVHPPDFPFTFQREHSLELSPDAKRLMLSVRHDASKMREQMAAAGETVPKISDILQSRTIATPKGRFSDAHQTSVNKMQSIANHASAWRKDPNRLALLAAAEKSLAERAAQTPSKSLKRSPSKAQLDSPAATPSKSAGKSSNRCTPAGSIKKTQSTSTEDYRDVDSSRIKRVKIADFPTVERTPKSSANAGETGISTPLRRQVDNSHPSNLATPSHTSLAHSNSVKSTKLGSKIPGLVGSPVKAVITSPAKANQNNEKVPLLSRTPTKSEGPSRLAASPTGRASSSKPMLDAALARTPGKVGNTATKLLEEPSEGAKQQKRDEPFLACSPVKMPIPRPADQNTCGSEGQKTTQHLLACSPLKISIPKATEQTSDNQAEQASSIPFFSRSPVKSTSADNPFASAQAESPDKAKNTELMGRFNLLRSTPMKSILRSPQRLYSNDPAKVAAGTHFATPPPKSGPSEGDKQVLAPFTAPVRKQVDFTASTKTRHEQSDTEGNKYSKRSTSTTEDKSATPTRVAGAISYPSLPSPNVRLTPSPEKRRQSAGPGDFTFRAGDGITFANSPRAGTAGKVNHAPTIRHVSAGNPPPPLAEGSKKRKFEFENKVQKAQQSDVPPPTGSKKRKFEFENETISQAGETKRVSGENPNSTILVDGIPGEDKENTPQVDERPAKRVKSSVVHASVPTSKTKKPEPAVAKRTTLGVKPKGVKTLPPARETGGSGTKKASTISQARLAALSMPKKRG